MPTPTSPPFATPSMLVAWLAFSLASCAADRAGQLLNDAGQKHLMGDQQEALRLYEEAARLEPGQPNAPYGKGLVLRAMGRVPEATAAFRESIRIGPRFNHAYLALARVQVDQKLQNDAIATLEQGHRLIPEDQDILALLEYLKALRFAETNAK